MQVELRCGVVRAGYFGNCSLCQHSQLRSAQDSSDGISHGTAPSVLRSTVSQLASLQTHDLTHS